jgi:kynurenine formamidase
MFVELSHPIVSGMTTYPGLAAPEVHTAISRAETAARLAPGVSFEIARLTLLGNTGTYLDAPFHYHPDRADIAEVPLERVVNVPIVVIRARGQDLVTANDLGEPGRLWGRAVLVHTAWSRHWGTERYLDPDCPHLSADAVTALIDANVALVGIDSLNVDDPTDPARPGHHGLLGADIPIVEHLTNLDQVPDEGARLVALPAPISGMTSFPVRAVAVHEVDS